MAAFGELGTTSTTSVNGHTTVYIWRSTGVVTMPNTAYCSTGSYNAPAPISIARSRRTIVLRSGHRSRPVGVGRDRHPAPRVAEHQHALDLSPWRGMAFRLRLRV